MQIIAATNHRQQVERLLSAEKLPVDDLPPALDNFIVVIQDDEIIAVAGLEIYGSYGLLRSVVVRSDQRGKGFAGQLLKDIEDLARNKGLTEIYLLTETAPDYFKKKGYIQVTRTGVPFEVQQSSEFSHVCPQSATAMKESL
jgi:amino-acid N-acetyltransferase